MDPKKRQKILDEAEEVTMNDLASQISSLTTLSEDKIKEIAPKIDNPEKLQELMVIINDATRTNEQKAEAIKAINGGAEIVSKILSVGL